jgi:hypothetical protein
VTHETADGGRRSAERGSAALPLATIYFCFCALYAWQAWRVGTPWLFTDELEYTQLARSIAEGGLPARRGEEHALDSLYPLLAAPAWLLDSTQSAYDTAKYIGVAAMTAAVFPAYALARLLVARRLALFAATATVAVPAFVYTGLLVSEPLAYLWSTLALYLFVKALATRRPGWIVLAAGAAVVAPLVRSQLAVLPAVLALAAGWLAWRSDASARLRRNWTRWDHAGVLLLLVGAALAASAVVGHRSLSWNVATRLNKDRLLDYGVWVGGALSIGLGILPVLVGLAWLARPAGEPRTPERAAFRAVFGASVATFLFYAGVKGAYLSTFFASRIYERNVIYLAPLFLVATAAWLERPRLRPWALAASAVAVWSVLAATPLQLDFPYFEAPGFGGLTWLNRTFEWSYETLHGPVLLAALAVSLVLVAAVGASRGRVRGVLAGAVALLVVTWSAAGQLEQSAGSRAAGEALRANLGEPVDWLDRRVGDAEVLYLGQRVGEPTGIHLLEFWNRSLRGVWSMDFTAPGPGPTLTPDVAARDGTLGYQWDGDYVVTDNGVEVQGDLVERRGPLTLRRIDRPLRLRDFTAGVYPDGWIGGFGSYSHFSGLRPGTVDVRLSRTGWGGPEAPTKVRVLVGPLVLDENRQPRIRHTTATGQWDAKSGEETTLHLRAPKPPFRVEVYVDRTFVPAQLDPQQSSDSRELGVQVGFGFDEEGDR